MPTPTVIPSIFHFSSRSAFMDMDNGISLTAPSHFRAFPYSHPYSIQTDLMRHTYNAIENRKMAIVESPTGTGKTLSLLTSALTWLNHHRQRSKRITLESLRDSLSSADDPEWVAAQAFERIRRELEAEERTFEDHLVAIRSREEGLRKAGARVTKRPRLARAERTSRPESGDERFLPEIDNTISREMTLESLPSSVIAGSKIFFASRTHSQLSQVVHETLKLKSLHAETNAELDERGNADGAREFRTSSPRYVPLASRSHYCINEALRSQTTDLDEGCRELLTGRQEDRCPYLPPPDEAHRLDELRDRILAAPKDVEDIVITGKELKLCPYFGSRAAIQAAEIITLPYNLLLHERSREALCINLQDQIVIIDEAHNLIDTLLQLHTLDLSTSTVTFAIRQLTEYLNRFQSRLNTVHAVHLKRLTLFLHAVIQFAEGRCSSPERDSEVMSVSSFVESMGQKVNGINLLELQTYLSKGKVARKVSSYLERRRDGGGGHEAHSRIATCGEINDSESSPRVPPLHAVESFISRLTNHIEDGIITVSPSKLAPKEKIIRYQHLNPATYFGSLPRTARSVILAGGTMSPIPDMTSQLFPGFPEEKMSIFSCGHVIPRSNLQCVVLGTGPRGKQLEFKFKNRDDQTLIGELGQCLFNISNLCPSGIVVFVPSYAFLDQVKEFWASNGLLSRIQRRKQIFYEPTEPGAVEEVLDKYTTACSETSETAKGALLLAVVGAKLSEGLNFIDNLARAVVLVGIPYPSLASPELRERMKYMNTRKQKANGTGVDPGSELYENLAMRAVNQSIGRAIRHQNDWSAIILIDKRYGQQKVQIKLPGWIRQSIVVPESFGQAVKLLGEFYRSQNKHRGHERYAKQEID